jgi:hypothetical protein
VWPSALSAQLSEPELAAIMTHEVAHVRRRDNLAALVQSLVEVLFWFHPLVPWIGRRLVIDRERACDAVVLNQGADRASYAQALVTVCRFSLSSPSPWLAGVLGPSLTHRVEEVMRYRRPATLRVRTVALLACALLAVVGGPILVGALSSRESAATPATTQTPYPRIPMGYKGEWDELPVMMDSVSIDGTGFAATFANTGSKVVTGLRVAAIIELPGRGIHSVSRSDMQRVSLAGGASTHIELPWLSTDELDRIQDDAGRRIQPFLTLDYVGFADGTTWTRSIDEDAANHMDALGIEPATIPRDLVVPADTPARDTPICLNEKGQKVSPGAYIGIRGERFGRARCVGGNWVEE